MEKKDKILLLSTIILIGFFIAVIFHYVQGFYLQTPYPLNTFLLEPSKFFTDFKDVLPKIKGFAPYSPPSDWQNYFPLAFLVLMPFAYINNVYFAYFLFVSIFLIFFVYCNYRFLKEETTSKLKNFQNIFILSFMSYPFFCLLDRGNFDMIVFIFFVLFVYLFQTKKYSLAALSLAVINAFKPFCFLFLVLFLFEKKYKEFFLSLGFTFILIIGGFLCFKGNIFSQMNVLFLSYMSMKKTYILSLNGGMDFTSSLFMALKDRLCYTHRLITTQMLDKIYMGLSLLITAITLFATYKEKIFWKKITLLTLYMLIVPATVFDYKLIFLFVPLWLFINYQEKSKFDVIYVILFASLLIPKKIVYFWTIAKGWDYVYFSVLFNPLIMLLLMGVIIFEQYKKRKENG